MSIESIRKRLEWRSQQFGADDQFVIDEKLLLDVVEALTPWHRNYAHKRLATAIDALKAAP